MTRCLTLTLGIVALLSFAAIAHPFPSYAGYSHEEIEALAAEVRENRPQMHRGGWEWDRLLTRYIDSGRKDQNELLILRAYFRSILDRYGEAKRSGATLTLFHNHRSWGSGGRMRIFAELVARNMITRDEQQAFATLVTDSLRLDFPDYSALERGVNNRPYGINGGPALAVQLFPDHPNAVRHKPWLEALWRELVEYGDTTETNYYPYGPLYLTGLLDMAQGMNKFETERDFLYQHARRYLYYIHGGGVRGNPNSNASVNPAAREELYADPWNARYYDEEANTLDSAVWYRLAQEFKDPEFLWASEQVCLGGRPPEGHQIPAAYLDAYKRRYFWFIERGIEPKVPKGGAAIGYYSLHKHRAPERLYLCSSRESGKPFASYYLFDRNNNYMHYCDDSDGKLYEYCVDGAKFLHTSGKYTSGRAGVGEGAYDMLTVLPPDMRFPIKEGQGMDTPTGQSWKMSSMSVKVALPSREGPDSKNWVFDDKIGKFRRRDEPTLGYSYGNMDGYWQLNNDYHLTSLRVGSFSAGTRIQNIRLAGPKGEKILAAGDSIPKNITVELVGPNGRAPLEGKLRELAVRSVEDGRRPGKCLEVGPIGPESKLSLTLTLDERFDAQNEFTRMSYDFLGPGTPGLTPNVRTNPRYFTPLWHRGAILVRDDLRAETGPSTGSGQANEDSFGQFTMRNYYGSRSRWTRQSVLTAEGDLIVRDAYTPCSDVDGYQAAPCWCIKADPESGSSGPNWFDAPARDHAWWQTRKKRVLLYLHPGADLTIGRVEHRTSGDIRGGNVHNTFAKAILQAGRPQIWLSVLRPFDDGQAAAEIAHSIKTKVDPAGLATAHVGGVVITISPDGQWSVTR